MNKNEMFLCKEGSCRKIKTKEILGIDSLDDFGLCCANCKEKKKCTSRCTILDCKRLKVEECGDRISYADCLEELLKEKREQLAIAKKGIKELEKEVSMLEGKIYINSPLHCKTCGTRIEFDTTKVKLSSPPFYAGECLNCKTKKYIEVSVYRSLKKE